MLLRLNAESNQIVDVKVNFTSSFTTKNPLFMDDKKLKLYLFDWKVN